MYPDALIPLLFPMTIVDVDNFHMYNSLHFSGNLEQLLMQYLSVSRFIEFAVNYKWLVGNASYVLVDLVRCNGCSVVFLMLICSDQHYD